MLIIPPSPEDALTSITSPVPPSSPTVNIEFYRKRAKALLKAFRENQPAAIERFRAAQSPVTETSAVKLADAQFVVARENGFSSWPQLKQAVESLSSAQPPHRPYVREIDWYRDRAEGLRRAYLGQMQGVHATIRQYHPRFAALSDSEMAIAEFTLDDSLLVQARQHGFESWGLFSEYIATLGNKETPAPFLLAFEALQKGDDGALRQLLHAEPTLTKARGSNGNSLLNLAASFRRNEACQILLDAGAPVNLGNNYGWTALHQAAPSNNFALVEKLLAAGGDLRLSARGAGGTPLVQTLFWGNAEMADFLAKFDVTPKNLRVAAGLGRLDLLGDCFDSKGNLTDAAKGMREYYRPHGEFPEWKSSNAPQEILNEAFTYACRNGRTEVLPFLLEHGAHIGGDPYQGTGLTWAAYKGHLETVRWLVEHGANINQQATFGGRNHGKGVTALHLAAQEGSLEKVRLLVELGANPDIPDDLFHSTPLGWAEFFGHQEVAAYLLSLPNVGVLNLASRGLTTRLGEVLKRDSSLANGAAGQTRHLPLHRSVENKHLDAARLLLENGANPNLQIHTGHTALDIATEMKSGELILVLKEFGGVRSQNK